MLLYYNIVVVRFVNGLEGGGGVDWKFVGYWMGKFKKKWYLKIRV